MFPEKLLTLWWQTRTGLWIKILAGVGILLLLIGLKSVIFDKNKEEEINFVKETPSSPSFPINKVFVDIEGAVVNPGVYEASMGAHLADALILAGGLAENADRDWVARNLNLALKLTDGAKIYIPARAEAGNSKLETGTESSVNNLININTANLPELDKLPGIGPVTAQKIIDNRPYSDVNELLNKKIVGQKVFEQIKSKIATY